MSFSKWAHEKCAGGDPLNSDNFICDCCSSGVEFTSLFKIEDQLHFYDISVNIKKIRNVKRLLKSLRG